jgi:ribosomal protein RSM22 (predicted rRNA methylase)
MNRCWPAVVQVLQDEVGLDLTTEAAGLAEPVMALSERFTRNLDRAVPTYLDEPALARAYLAYYLPVNASKIAMLLAEMPKVEQGDSATRKAIRVLDVGGGPGTALLPVIEWYARQLWRDALPLELVTIDRSVAALSLGERLAKNVIRRLGLTQVRVTPIRADLELAQGSTGGSPVIPEGPFDLIVVANCLNELYRSFQDPVAMRVTLTRRCLDVLTVAGTVMIVEPALRPVARDLHLLRDALVGNRACNVYSPCLHDRSCPALINPNDWCHEERPWTAPDWVTALDRQVGFIKDALKFSYLLLRKDGKTIVPREPNAFRVVSELRIMKGDQRAWLCNETGRPEVGRLDRERSEMNASMDGWRRGAIVRISEIVRKERKGRESTVGRIPSSATIEIIRSV